MRIYLLSQAAYRAGRDTTEQFFTIKLLAEKVITTPNYETHFIFMDMSKVFRVERHRVIEDLKTILEEDELHMPKLLIKDVKLAVRVKGKLGEFLTHIGTPQGDRLSSILFTVTISCKCTHKVHQPTQYHPGLPTYLRDHNCCYT